LAVLLDIFFKYKNSHIFEGNIAVALLGDFCTYTKLMNSGGFGGFWGI
jgi:hypothetical protein